jgi:hypothetical protein
MLTHDESASLQSAIKLVRMILQRTDLPWNKKAEADEALRHFMSVVCESAELPDATPYERPAAAAAA